MFFSMAMKWNITPHLCVLLLSFILQGNCSNGGVTEVSEGDADIFSPFWIYRGSCLANCFKNHPVNASICLTKGGCPETSGDYEHICNTTGCEVIESCSAEEKPELVWQTFSRGNLNISWRNYHGGNLSDVGVLMYRNNNSEHIETVFQTNLSSPISALLPRTYLSYFTFADCGLTWSQEVFDCDDIEPLHNVTDNILHIWVPPYLKAIFEFGFQVHVRCEGEFNYNFGGEDYSDDLSVKIDIPLNEPVTCYPYVDVYHQYHDYCSTVELPAFILNSDAITQQSASVHNFDHLSDLAFDHLSDLAFDQEDDSLTVSWQDCPSATSPPKSVYLHWGQLRLVQSGNRFDDNQFILLPENATSLNLSGLNAGVEYGFQVFCVYNESYIDFLNTSYHKMNYGLYTLEPYAVTVLSLLSSQDEPSSLLYPLVGISGGVFVVVFMMCLVFLVYHRGKSTKNKIRRMEQSIQNVYDDHPSRNPSRKSSAASDQMTLSDFHKSVMLSDHWEFDPKRLRLGSSLGKGAFGQVVEGFLEGRVCVRQYLKSGLEWVPEDTGKKDVTHVAVKLLKDFASDAQKQEFLQEIQMMKFLGYHQNVVCLIGCCTVMDPVCLVVEACPQGDLKKYLLNSRNRILMRLKEENLEVEDLLTVGDLLSFARQITMGMEYLSQKGYVHRDLAARNVLVSEDKSMKIADFGLTRYIYEERQYIGKKGARIPVKWMSVEAIIDGVYTTESDVWSFGVILYEIIKLGGEPYPGIVNKDLAKMLCSGFRMERPEQCPDDLYTMMLDCWHESPKQRPQFTKLRLRLEAMLELDTPYLSLYPSQAHTFSCLEDIREDSNELNSASEDEPMLEEGSVKTEGSRQPSPLRLAISQSDSELVEQAGSDDSLLEGQSKELVDRVVNGSSEYINRSNKFNEMAISLLSSPDSCDSGVAIDTRFLYDSEGKVLEYEGDEQIV